MADFNVHPDTLDAYSGGLSERSGRVQAAADRIRTVNGGDINAFGVAVGQVLGIPTRIALGVLHDQVSSAAKAFATQDETVRNAAGQYRANEGKLAQNFSGMFT
jgi:uncharacterized protein YukE